MTKASIVARFQPGQRVRVTNHYITRPDHPCFGTHDRTVTRVNGSAVWFEPSGRVAWPKAAQMWMQGNTITLYGGGAGQAPHERFLTIELLGVV